jgi:hypothetical protein
MSTISGFLSLWCGVSPGCRWIGGLLNMLMKLRIYKMRGISGQAEEMLAFQKGLCSLEWVSYSHIFMHMCVCVFVCLFVLMHVVPVCKWFMIVHLHESPYIVTSEQVTNLLEIWNESHIIRKHSTIILCDSVSSVYECTSNANLRNVSKVNTILKDVLKFSVMIDNDKLCCALTWPISIMKPTWYTFHSVYWESRASTCFEHYLLILRRRVTNGTSYVAYIAAVAVSLQSWHSQLTLYARNIWSGVCVAPPDDWQVMLETCRGPWFSINWMKSASR